MAAYQPRRPLGTRTSFPFLRKTTRFLSLLFFFFFFLSLPFLASSSCFLFFPNHHSPPSLEIWSSSLSASFSSRRLFLFRVSPPPLSSSPPHPSSSSYCLSHSSVKPFASFASPASFCSPLLLSSKPSPLRFFEPFFFFSSSLSSSPSPLYATRRSGRPKASSSSSSRSASSLSKRQHPEEDEDEEAEEEEDRTSFSFDPTQVKSRFGNLTGGVYTPESAPPFPPETQYFPSFPPKYVTPVPARLPRWHPRSPFPPLQPRGPFYPEQTEEERKAKKYPPKFRRFKGRAPPPDSLPPPLIELKRNFKHWVRSPLYHYPQFTTLAASLKYRRRLKKTSRRLDLRLSRNLPYRRMYFAWRRNMRDQEMHRWMSEKARVSLLTSRYWKHRYALQAAEWHTREDKREEPAPVPAEEDAHRSTEDEEEGEEEATDDDDDGCGVEGEAENAAPELARGQRRLRSSEEKRGRTGKEEEEDEEELTESERGSLILEEIISYIEDPSRSEDLYEEVVYGGYRLPLMTAAVASSPFPWYTSAKGLQKWRGRKTAENVQSRWVDWSQRARPVEAALGDRLIPRQGKIVEFLKQKGLELKEALTRELRGDTTQDQQQEGEKEERKEKEREKKGRREEEKERESEGVEERGPEMGEEELREGGQSEGDGEKEGSKEGEKEKEKHEEEIRRRKRRAIEAAMDVSILLGQSIITKDSGACNPYDVHSPFVKTQRSSRRRRMRLRGRLASAGHPEERNMSRQERRLARYARRRKEEEEERERRAQRK